MAAKNSPLRGQPDNQAELAAGPLLARPAYRRGTMFTPNKIGQTIVQRLSTAVNESLMLQVIHDPALEEVAPGMARLAGCGQGTKTHFEGDVAAHTAKVVLNQKKVLRLKPLLHLDRVDLLAALLHDLEKPSTRVEHADGGVSFPGHEMRAASRVPKIAARLELSPREREKLFFLIRHHGDAHDFPNLSKEVQLRLALSPYWLNLMLLQAADAVSCFLNPAGTKTLPIRSALFETALPRFEQS
jgi:hypothetical protein